MEHASSSLHKSNSFMSTYAKEISISYCIDFILPNFLIYHLNKLYANKPNYSYLYNSNYFYKYKTNQPSDDHLLITSWNVNSINSINNRFNRLHEIKKINPQLILLQETRNPINDIKLFSQMFKQELQLKSIKITHEPVISHHCRFGQHKQIYIL